jgi:hypothetical protein
MSTAQEIGIGLPALRQIQGGIYSMRYERTRSLDDLNRAVEATDETAKTTPSDHPDRAG